MTWLKLDDRFGIHPKIRPLSDKAYRLHTIGLLCAAGQLSDGNLSHYDVDRCLVDANRASRKHVDELVGAGLWIKTVGGYAIKDYLEYNPPASKIKAERDRNADRQRRFREANAA